MEVFCQNFSGATFRIPTGRVKGRGIKKILVTFPPVMKVERNVICYSAGTQAICSVIISRTQKRRGSTEEGCNHSHRNRFFPR